MSDKTGTGFARDGNTSKFRTACKTTSASKPAVVMLAHHKLLVNEVAEHASLKKHVRVNPLIREDGFMCSFSEQDIDAALADANVLVLCPMRHSVHKDTSVFEIERYAVKQARERKIWLGLVVVEDQCAYPAYLDTHEPRVMAIATFDDNHAGLRRTYHLATCVNLREISSQDSELHAIFRREKERERIPEHLDKFGRLLADLAQHPYRGE